MGEVYAAFAPLAVAAPDRRDGVCPTGGDRIENETCDSEQTRIQESILVPVKKRPERTASFCLFT